MQLPALIALSLTAISGSIASQYYADDLYDLQARDAYAYADPEACPDPESCPGAFAGAEPDADYSYYDADLSTLYAREAEADAEADADAEAEAEEMIDIEARDAEEAEILEFLVARGWWSDIKDKVKDVAEKAKDGVEKGVENIKDAFKGDKDKDKDKEDKDD